MNGMELLNTASGAVVHHLWTVSWQVCVLAALVLIAERVYRNTPPGFRYWLWMLVLARLCVPVEFALPTGMQGYIRMGAGRMMEYFRKPPEPAVVLSRPEITASEPYTVFTMKPPISPEPAPAPMPPLSASSLALIAWAGIVLLTISAGLIRSAMLRRRLERCDPVERPDLIALLRRLRREMGIRRPVELIRLGKGGLNTPAVAGIFHPRIWLPSDIADSWAAEEIEPILLHELAHIRRNDLLANRFQGILQAVYFFHPAVWFSNREIRRAREEICDDMALSRLASGRRGYTRSLLRVVEMTSDSATGLAALALTEGKSGAAARIRRIMSARYHTVPRLTLRMAALVALIGAAGLSLASPNSGGWGTAKDGANPLLSIQEIQQTVTPARPPELVGHARTAAISSPDSETMEIAARIDSALVTEKISEGVYRVNGVVVPSDSFIVAVRAALRKTAYRKGECVNINVPVGTDINKFPFRALVQDAKKDGVDFGNKPVLAIGLRGVKEGYLDGVILVFADSVNAQAGEKLWREKHPAVSGKVSSLSGKAEAPLLIIPNRKLTFSSRISPVKKKVGVPLNNSFQLKLARGISIRPGSEHVTLNGDTLSRNSDYRIDYILGRITILRPEAFASTANIEVRYEESASPSGTGAPSEPGGPEDESFKEALRTLTQDHDYSQGTIDRFQGFIDHYPQSNHVPEAKFYIAICRYNTRQFRDAALLFESFAYKYPNHGFVPEALFYLADSNYKLENFEEAVKGFDTLLEHYPKNKKAEEALFTKAWALLDLNQDERAIETLNLLVKKFPGGRFAASALLGIGDYYYNAQQYAKARETYLELQEKYPKSEAAAKVAATLKELTETVAYNEYESAFKVFSQAREKNDKNLYRQAAEMFLKVLETYPETESAAGAYVNALFCYGQLGESKRVIELNLKFQKKYGSPGTVLPPEMEPTFPPKE